MCDSLPFTVFQTIHRVPSISKGYWSMRFVIISIMDTYFIYRYEHIDLNIFVLSIHCSHYPNWISHFPIFGQCVLFKSAPVSFWPNDVSLLSGTTKCRLITIFKIALLRHDWHTLDYMHSKWTVLCFDV